MVAIEVSPINTYALQNLITLINTPYTQATELQIFNSLN